MKPGARTDQRCRLGSDQGLTTAHVRLDTGSGGSHHPVDHQRGRGRPRPRRGCREWPSSRHRRDTCASDPTPSARRSPSPRHFSRPRWHRRNSPTMAGARSIFRHVERVLPAGPPSRPRTCLSWRRRSWCWPRRGMSWRSRPLACERGVAAAGRFAGAATRWISKWRQRLRPISWSISLCRRHVGPARRPGAGADGLYVVIGGALGDTAATLSKLGTVLGTPARAEILARYADAVLLLVSRLAECRRQTLSLYSARGPKGLETAPGSTTEAIEFYRSAGRGDALLGAPRHRVDTELVPLAWQPDVIIANDAGFYDAVWHDPLRQQLAAVKAKHVYLALTPAVRWTSRRRPTGFWGCAGLPRALPAALRGYFAETRRSASFSTSENRTTSSSTSSSPAQTCWPRLVSSPLAAMLVVLAALFCWLACRGLSGIALRFSARSFGQAQRRGVEAIRQPRR